MSGMTFNQICAEIEPIHELPYLKDGEYEGQITDVVKGEINGKPVWKVHFHCPEGIQTHTIWAVTPQEFNEAALNPDQMTKLKTKIGMLKAMMVDLGLPKPISYNEGALNIVSMLPDLKGKRCRAVVTSKEGSKYPNVYLKKSENAVSENALDNIKF